MKNTNQSASFKVGNIDFSKPNKNRLRIAVGVLAGTAIAVVAYRFIGGRAAAQLARDTAGAIVVGAADVAVDVAGVAVEAAAGIVSTAV